MANPVEAYAKAIHTKFGFHANWLPNAKRELGDVGLLRNRQFERVTTLKALGVLFESRSGPPGDHLSHSSSSGVKVATKLKGEPLAGASLPLDKAGVAVSFSSSGAFVFQASSPSEHEIEDQDALEKALVLMLKEGAINGERVWKDDWCVVTSLMRVDGLTVLMADSAAASVELEAGASLGPGGIPLVTAAGDLSVAHQSGQVTSVLVATNTAPLLRLSKLKRDLLDRLFGGDPELGRANPAAAPAAKPAGRLLEPVPID